MEYNDVVWNNKEGKQIIWLMPDYSSLMLF